MIEVIELIDLLSVNRPEHPGISLDAHGYPQTFVGSIFLNIHAVPWASFKMHAYAWVPMDSFISEVWGCVSTSSHSNVPQPAIVDAWIHG